MTEVEGDILDGVIGRRRGLEEICGMVSWGSELFCFLLEFSWSAGWVGVLLSLYLGGCARGWVVWKDGGYDVMAVRCNRFRERVQGPGSAAGG